MHPAAPRHLHSRRPCFIFPTILRGIMCQRQATLAQMSARMMSHMTRQTYRPPTETWRAAWIDDSHRTKQLFMNSSLLITHPCAGWQNVTNLESRMYASVYSSVEREARQLVISTTPGSYSVRVHWEPMSALLHAKYESEDKNAFTDLENRVTSL